MFRYRLYLFSQNPVQSTVVDAIRNQAQYFGIDAKVMYDPSFPVEAFHGVLTGIHGSLGSTWPTTVLFTASLFRIVTFPFYMNSVMVGKKRADAAKDLADIRGLAKDAVLLRDQKLLQDVDKEYKSRLQAKGLTNNPFQGLGYAAFIQMPWTITMFLGLRGMSSYPDSFPGFCFNSDFLWCPSLALPDPYGVLPLLSSLIILRSVKRSANSGSRSERDILYFKYAMTGATMTFLPFAMQLPSGMIMFFLVNTIFNRLTTPLINSYFFRKN